MGAQGTTTVDFGAFPGAHEATAVVTGQAAIVAGSLVEAWLRPAATADHSVDEHNAEFPSIKVWAQDIVGGTGFTIYARYEPAVREDLRMLARGTPIVPDAANELANNYFTPALVPSVGGTVPRIYGLWTVAWVWN